jgi:hypothetical protein
VNGKFLAHHASRLNRICKKLELKTFDDYVSYTPDEAEAMLEEFGGNPDVVEFPEAKWFSAEEGLEFAQRLSSYLEAHLQQIKDADRVLSDLKEFIRVFEQAETIKAKWHLQVDF